MRHNTIVTGGTRGIGAAISRSLHNAGYNVFATYVNNDENAQKFSEQYNIRTVKCNAQDLDNCTEMVNSILKEYGDIGLLVNNAGITKDGFLHKMDSKMWNDVINTNLTSIFNMCTTVIAQMRKNYFGRIINISSINGFKGQIGQTNYSAAKSGIIGFSKSLALEVARKGITVNCIAPGYIDTDMIAQIPQDILNSIIKDIPVGRLGNPEDIARCVLFLASDDANFITGETIHINGGMHMH